MPADAVAPSPASLELQRQIDELSSKLRDSERRHALVIDAVAEGIYEWNIATNALRVSERLNQIFGFEGRALAAGDWNRLVHPEDFAGYRNALRACLKGARRRLDCEYRLRHADGVYRWVEDRAVAVLGKDGRAVRLVGAVSDVTARKESERALREALEHQTAISEVLEAIGRSTSDIQPVLDTMLAAALRLCRTESGGIAVQHGDVFRYVATLGWDPVADQAFRDMDIVPGRGTVAGRVLQAAHVVQVEDVASDPEFERRDLAALSQWHTALGVPLMRGGRPIGAIAITRDRIEPFTERQIGLVRTFADQAVIAMENARLLNELRQRTDDLQESLAYQTAIGEVLTTISRSTFDLEPVLQTLAETVLRLCEAEMAFIVRRDGERFVVVTAAGATPESARRARDYHLYQKERPLTVDRGSLTGRVALEKRPVQIADVTTDPEYKLAAASALGKIRTQVGVPLIREGALVGVMVLSRHRVEPFSQRQVNLLRTFADQAVIAMENARLLGELRESLDQQTATSDVLKTISRSSVGLETVLQTLVETVGRLCRADQSYLYREEDGLHRLLASHGLSDDVRRYFSDHPFEPTERTLGGRVIRSRQTVHIADVLKESDYGYGEGQRLAGYRTMLGIPLLAQDKMVGVFIVTRTRVDPFTDKETALASGFADQAVIAIENARLFEELRERQNELRTTFDNIGDAVLMFDDQLRLRAWNRNFQELLDIPDAFLAQRPSYDEYVRMLVERGEFGSADGEAETRRLLRDVGRQWASERTRPDGRVIGVRNNPVPGGGTVAIYSDITERKKAEAEIRAARDAAETALEKLKAAQANLVQAEKMASLGQLTAGIAHEIKNPLNFVNNFATLSVELVDELKEALSSGLAARDEDRRAEIDETMQLLVGNLSKIAEHGRRADGIVKSMLSHSRGGTGDWQEANINTLVDEAVNLAYHGARAQDKDFNVTLQRDLAPQMTVIEVVPQDVTRVFLNLFGNAFYATTRRHLAGADAGYRPTVTVSTRDLGQAVEIKVRDNGTGIQPETRARLFEPFFTTKPTGEGTGLGLSISYDIVTQQHGGAIEVESEPGSFTEFIVRLPRRRRTAPTRATP